MISLSELVTAIESAEIEELRDALLAAVRRIANETDAALKPENAGKPPCPSSMLRVYVFDEVACAIGTGHRCVMDHA